MVLLVDFHQWDRFVSQLLDSSVYNLYRPFLVSVVIAQHYTGRLYYKERIPEVVSQHRKVEDVMHMLHFRRKGNLIRHRIDFLNNLIWSDVSRC